MNNIKMLIYITEHWFSIVWYICFGTIRMSFLLYKLYSERDIEYFVFLLLDLLVRDILELKRLDLSSGLVKAVLRTVKTLLENA